MNLLPHQVRVVVEYDELVAMLDELSEYLEHGSEHGLETTFDKTLHLKKTAMTRYATVLKTRIDAFT